MLKERTSRLGVLFLGILAAALLVVVPSALASHAASTATTIRIWTDQDRKAAVDKVTSAWAASRGVDVQVVLKPFGNIRDDLKTVKADQAPDVIVGAHDWTGQLAADGLVVPLFPKKSVTKLFPKYALDAFSYGGARLYGAPVALENVGLVVNRRLAKVPRTWAQLEKAALAFKAKAPDNLAIAVQQGNNGDAYHMYPFFSGLCGYVFGKTKSGALNPRNLGIANRKFLRNAPLIDRWNREGLINAKVDDSAAREAFLNGKAAFWVTGPWNIDLLRQHNINFTVIQVPKIRCASVPFLGVQGFMVTKFSNDHGVSSLAKDLVSDYMMRASAQRDLANANKRFPANRSAGRQVSDPALAQFGRASKGGVPMPNIPQMNNVWSDLGAAWVKATKGAGAVPARSAFTVAAQNIAKLIG